jgi:molybdenum cofactor synthesis domain-containing protein
VLSASMVVIGDELLSGFVTDLNSPWFADRCRAHGVPLERVHVVPDDMAAIAEALHLELARSRPRVIVTSGGIGSTPDDLTYEAVAAAFGLDLVEDPTLAAVMERIRARTAEAGFATDGVFVHHLMRMARIPAGSRLLPQQGGWSPAVVVDVDGGADDPGGRGASIVVLPGVPGGFRTLLSEAVEPVLLAGRNDVPHVRELTHDLSESLLNGAFVALGQRFPEVRLGSYPGSPMLVRLTGPEPAVEAAADFMRAALDALEADPAAERLRRRRRGDA